ncbi:uncharacterized protein LOC131434243 [Malaya genurostris]|uniref:uncharacterized protein LOC131434243 n=1 Tax=Malaya genurostris TaxID=325434 RepID=UPI0026F3C651|nr:uncharacterized protein LOC131434243 [Malaya genurostris]
MEGPTLLSMVISVTVLWFPVASGFEFAVHFNMSEYWQMPALFQYESIEGCLRFNPAGVFCIVKSVVKPDGRSQVWNAIEKYSQYPYQYQHSVLTRGICMRQCEELVETLSDSQKALFFQPKFDVEYKYIINDWLLSDIDKYRQQYGKLVNICQNYRMQAKYNVSVYSEIEHCTTNTTRAADYLDIAFYATIVAIAILATASSVYDSWLAKDHNHYRTPLNGKKTNLLTAFSLRRNINRLTIKLNTDSIQRDLRFLDAVRVHVITTITVSHVIIGLGMTTSQNPEVMEKLLSKPEIQMFISIVPFEVDVFFAISGLLLAVHFIKYTEGKRFGFKPFWMGVVNRYLRSLPVYALVMLFSTSVYDRFQVSPSAYKIMPMVRTICRDKWWINFLFVNNYYRPEEQCLIHTWYLAADFQLFIVGLTILMVLWKWKSVLRPVMYVLLTCGVVLPMLNVYFNSMDAMMLLTHKGSAFQLWYDQWFTRTYQATETHCLCYFAGMLVGIIYHKMQKDDLLLAKSKLYKTLQYVTFPLLVLFCLPAPLFQHFSFSKPSVWMSFYAGVHRLVVTCFVNIGFLLFMFAERDSLFGKLRRSSLLENAYYRVLGRLSFGFYLIHMNVMKTVYGNHHEALRISYGIVISVFCSVTLITYVLSFMAYILVEKPFDIIFKQVLGGGTKDGATKGAHISANCQANNNSDFNHISSKRQTLTAMAQTRCRLRFRQQAQFTSMFRVVRTFSKMVQSALLLSIVIAIVLGRRSTVSGMNLTFKYDLDEYRRMPVLHQYDSFESCMRSKPLATFCVVKTVVKPNNQSELWRIMEKYSQHPYQYRHSVLSRGICVERCEKLVSDMSVAQRQTYYQRKFDVKFKYITNDWLLPNIEAYRQEHGFIINICENYELQTKYNLTAFSEIEHCTTNDLVTRQFDIWDILFWLVLIFLALLGICSTYCDAKLAKKGDHAYYQKPLKDKKSNLLTAFSIRRNIHRLTEAPGDSQLQRDLSFLDALRVFAMAVVIYSHVLIGQRMVTNQNPEQVEIADSTPLLEIIASICPFTVNIFLAISGLLLALFFVKYTENKRFNISHLWLGLVNRYLRSFPVYLAVMLYVVSVSDLLQFSPSAYRFMVLSKAVCRKKWWINFLYISNYYQPEELCLIHTWYLSADFQLFVIGLVAMMVMWRFPQSYKWLMGVLFGIGFAAPAIRTYIYSLDAMMPISNKGHSLRLWYERLYIDFYQTTDVHCASYFAGMFVGIIYHRVHKNAKLLRESQLFKICQYMVIPLLAIFFLPAPIFHHLDFPKPSLWMGIFAGMHRWAFAICLGVIFLVYMFSASGTLFGWLRESRILQNSFIRVSGRLSFSIYLIHMSVLEAVLANHHEAMRLSAALAISVLCSVTLISYFLAFLAFVFIEKPFDIIFKQLLTAGSRNVESQKPKEIESSNSNASKQNLKVRVKV